MSSRQRSRTGPRVAAALVAMVFVALAFGIAQHASAPARTESVGVSLPGAPGRISPTGRASATNAFLALPQPFGHRRSAPGDLFLSVAVAAAACLFVTRARLFTSRRLHFETVFAFRRGPPTLVAR
jgi:hypothetical protein